MSIFKNDIQGNANVSRNMNVGGHANVNGDAFIGHNLIVKGWLDAPNIKGPLKGLYASSDSLTAAYPRPMPGWFALVGNTLPADVYRVEGGKWIPTGEKGGVFSLYLDQLETDVRDLTDEVKDIEELLADGILLAETITFSSTGTAASMAFTVLKRDGTTKQGNKPIPIATTEKAGMMTAADKKMLLEANSAIIEINSKIKAFETITSSLKTALDKETADRTQADSELQNLIDTLRRDFDALVGENASEAIDNFTEVLRFLDGLNDTEKLSTKLAALSGADEKLSADVLELQQKVFPLVVTFNVSPTVIKAGQKTTISLSWNAERKEQDVTADADIAINGSKVIGKSMTLDIVLKHRETQPYQLRTSYAGMADLKTGTVKGTLPTYFGIVAKTWVADEASVSSLSELIIGDRSLTRTGIATNDGKIVLAYPKDFGALTSVKDGNGYEVLSSYSRTEVTVNDHIYYCYLLTVPVTASGVTQIYK